MFRFGIAGAVFFALLSLAATTAGSALAALPESLPTSGVTISGSSGKSGWQIQGGGTFKCEKDKPLGMLIGPKTWELDTHYEGCKALGFSANSPGDGAGVILMLSTDTMCYLSAASKVVGLSAQISPNLQIEIPTAKQKLELKGTVISELKPINKLQTTGEAVRTQKEGKSGIEKCEGQAAAVLLAKEAEKEFKSAGEEAVESFTFSKAVEVMA
jgi:hypothetical protein